MPDQQLDRLTAALAPLDGLVVAFSGGVDSTLLLAVAAQVLGDRVLAGTVRSVLNPPSELELARTAAAALGVRHEIVDLDPLQDPRVAANPPDRCYYCKLAVFSALRELALRDGFPHVAHAEHVDDLSDHRPGRKAAEELGILAPLAEAGLNKQDIRRMSRELGLPGWDRPSMACLASRIPYGDALTAPRLERVAKAEAGLRELGLGQLRVRDHGQVARVELAHDDLARLADPQWRGRVGQCVREAGFRYVSVDVDGFRSGSMNEVL